MNQDKSEAVDYLFSEMLRKGISIDDLCKRWGGKFVADTEVSVVSEPLPFKVLYKSGHVYDCKVLGEIPIAIFVERCFVSLWDLPQRLSFAEAFFEIDPRLTKDSVIVLMHDETIDRTTTGKGKVSDYTYAELQQFNLVDRDGKVTDFKIPTLKA